MSLKKRLGRAVQGRARRKLMLFPLMDMFFILLLYFIVTAGMHPDLRSEKGTIHTTPVEKVGNSQIFIQVINADSLRWLDNTSFTGAWKSNFRNSNIITNTFDALKAKLQKYYEELGNCAGTSILVTIRCPGYMDYMFINTLEKRLQSLFEDILRGNDESGIANKEIKRELAFNLIEGIDKDIMLKNVTRHKSDSVEIVW
jgi:hypothetical protein